MQLRRQARRLGFVGAVSLCAAVLVAACADSGSDLTAPFDPGIAPNRALAEAILDATRAGQQMRGSDDMHSYLNAIAPGGVGGVFQSVEGTLNVYLKDLSHSEDAIAQLVGSQRADRTGRMRFPSRKIRTIQGQYDWAELRGWYESLLEMRLPATVNGYDIDESLNRVRLVVSSAADRALIQQVLATNGIPKAAVHFEIAQMPVLATALQAQEIQDTDDPLRGGFAIRPDRGALHCTLGFNTKFGGNKRGFVTATHCTELWGAVTPDDSVRNGLEIEFDDRIVADEVKDDAFFGDEIIGCPAGALCRWSDAAMYQYRSASTPKHGIIANTVEVGRTLAAPDWSIQDDDPHCPWVPWCGIVGSQQLTKVGSVTGRSTGTLKASCIVQPAFSSRFNATRHWLCSDRVDGVAGDFVGAGDSGSPVFEELEGANVELWGILFAANNTEPSLATQYWFSRIRNIRTELGSFQTVDEGPGGPVNAVPTGGRLAN